MKKKKIYIFGDSYADEKNYKFANYTWTNLLRNRYENLYDVENFSHIGTGPLYNVQLLIDKINSGEIDLNDSNNVILFFLSLEQRVNFPGGKIGDLEQIVYNFKDKRVIPFLDTAQTSSDYYNNFKSEIDFYFLTNEKELKNLNLKNISFLMSLSQLYNIKILSFMCHIPYTETDNTHCLGNFYDKIRNGNFNNFALYPKILKFVSENEISRSDYDKVCANNSKNFAKIIDKRINHLSEDNHRVFYESICEFIDLGKLNNKISFYENFLSFENAFIRYSRDYNLEQDVFIYD